ncbi:MAG: response regulator transcription factor [Myxococcales bacterium]|nr:response regulator transcription factor [Myxococcales bacterium]
MNLLLLTEAAGLQERLRRALEREHRLTSVADVPAALQHLDGGPFDALIVDWSLSRASAANAIESVRRASRGERLFVLAMIEREQAVSIQSVYRTGVDDFVIKPCMLEELNARLDCPRTNRRAGEAQPPVKETRAKPILAPGPTTSNVELAVLSRIPGIATGAFRTLTGIDVRQAPWRMPPRPAFAARISLSLAPQPIALALSLAVEAAPLRWLASHVLSEGDVRRSSLENLVCEIASTFAASVKRAALQDGLNFKPALPTVVPLHAVGWGAPGSGATEPPQAFGQQVSCTLTADDPRFELSLIASVARVRHVSLPMARIREGMVLGEELDGGALSAPVAAGTCLSGATLDRLTRALDPDHLVRVEERIDPLLHGD